MIGLLVFLLCLVAWPVIGFRLAVANAPRSWAKARKAWTYSEDVQRGSAKGQFITMVLLWPFYWPLIRISDRLDTVVVDHDPVEQEKRIQNQQARIAELERELGIGQPAKPQRWYKDRRGNSKQFEEPRYE